MSKTLEKMFGSRVRAKILGWLFTHPGEAFFVRQMALILEEDPTNVSREMAGLENLSVLKSSRSGNLKHFQTNRECPFFEKRNDFIYDPERPIPKTEAVKSLESAEQFVEEISQRIEKMNPQKRLIP
jgi:hypothetical protein